MEPLHWLERGFEGRAAFDTAASRALLDAVARAERPETLRLYRPDDVVAFSTTDARLPGFPAALRAAREAGFDASLRLAGGSAAVFHRETLAFGWCRREEDPRRGIQERFGTTAEWIARALRKLGVDARVGPVPGEYCPGDYSVNARGRVKLMGVGQRVVRGASWTGGVLVVGGRDRADAALAPVYAALGLPYDARATGSVEDEIGRVGLEAVRDALLAELPVAGEGARAWVAADFDAGLLEAAEAMEDRHRAEGW